MSKTLYLGYYAKNPDRVTSPAAQTMMEYVVDALSKSMEELTVLSFAHTRKKYGASREESALKENVCLISFPSTASFPTYRLFARLIKKIKRKRMMDRELETFVEDGDTVIAYHSPELIGAIGRLRRKRKIRLVLQVCEIYADVTQNKRQRKRELAFIHQADAYIFGSALLEEKINRKRAPFVVCLGTYRTERERKRAFDDGRIHCIYAGTFDPRKGGALTAVEAGVHLGEEYHLHILGFGNEKETETIRQKVEEVSSIAACTVTYDGCLSGREYSEFIQSCDIGLSTQNPKAAFNATSFPSKILSYMANGLRVVSVRIPAVEGSDVGQFVNYYERQTPKEIAEAIRMAAKTKDFDGRIVLQELDKRFRFEIKKLLEKQGE